MSDPRGGVCFGPFLLNPAERLLLRDGRAVPLTPKAFDLLALLVANSGHLLSKDELIEKLWPGTFVEEANLAYNVSAIRKALGEGSETDRYIETVPRRGYRFVGPVAPNAAGAHEPSTLVTDGSVGPRQPRAIRQTGPPRATLACLDCGGRNVDRVDRARRNPFRETPPRSMTVRFQNPGSSSTRRAHSFRDFSG